MIFLFDVANKKKYSIYTVGSGYSSTGYPVRVSQMRHLVRYNGFHYLGAKVFKMCIRQKRLLPKIPTKVSERSK